MLLLLLFGGAGLALTAKCFLLLEIVGIRQFSSLWTQLTEVQLSIWQGICCPAVVDTHKIWLLNKRESLEEMY